MIIKKFDNYSDNDLIQLVRQGDLKAYKYLFDKYYSNLNIFVKQIVNDKDSSEDVVQDLFVGLWQKRNNLNIQTSVKAYLFQWAKNAAINWNIAHKRVQTSLDGVNLKYDISEYTPENELCFEQLTSELETAVEGLPKQAKEVFKMRYFEQTKQKDISEKLQISESTVEKHMMNALKQLRNSLSHMLSILLYILSSFYPYIF